MLMQPSTDLYIMLTSIDGSVGLVVLPEFSSVPFIQNFCVMFDCSSLKILVKSDPLFSSPVRRSILWHYQEHAIFQLKKFPDVIDRKWIIIWSTDGSLLAKEAWLNNGNITKFSSYSARTCCAFDRSGSMGLWPSRLLSWETVRFISTWMIMKTKKILCSLKSLVNLATLTNRGISLF